MDTPHQYLMGHSADNSNSHTHGNTHTQSLLLGGVDTTPLSGSGPTMDHQQGGHSSNPC